MSCQCTYFLPRCYYQITFLSFFSPHLAPSRLCRFHSRTWSLGGEIIALNYELTQIETNFLLTWAVVRVVKLHDDRVSIVGDVDGGTVIVVQDDGTQTGVMWSLMRGDVNGRLPVPLGNREVFVPYRRTLKSNQQRIFYDFNTPGKAFSMSLALKLWADDQMYLKSTLCNILQAVNKQKNRVPDARNSSLQEKM